MQQRFKTSMLGMVMNGENNTWIKSIDGQNRYHADHRGMHEELPLDHDGCLAHTLAYLIW